MFQHGKTGKKYYSIREKINYYNRVISGKEKGASAITKRKAPLRLKTLKRLNEQDYKIPRLIVTNDEKFGNGIGKPRLCVTIDEDSKGRVLVAPIHRRTSKSIILDRDFEHQVNEKKRWIDKSDLYETKNVSNVKPLTRYDKEKVIGILRHK